MKIDSEHIKRRTWLGGAASIGAVVAGSIAVARRNPVVAGLADVEKTAAALEPGTGYQLSEHVKRYYATARV